ncbi:hypothetical protein ABPG75_010483 [Micractinium tetrahymenae]
MACVRLALVGLLLAFSCATARPAPSAGGAAACDDRPPPTYTCAQQKGWGKCGEAFMAPFCARTCGRCGDSAGNGTSAIALPALAATIASSNASATAPPPAPTATATASASTTQLGGLSGNVAEYGKVLGMSWQFMYAQRSGRLSEAPSNPIPWRSDDHLDDPVVGGFFDAGDHLKLNFPLATSLTFLAWGALEFPAAYATTGQTQAALENLRWGADYLMACHPSDNTYIAQIGEPGADHAYWGRPEEQRGPRPAYTWDASKPASDAAGAAASALASASLLFKSGDPAFAADCLDHARRLFTFASTHEGKYSASQPGPTYVYPSTQFEDDLAFAAAWLYRATGEEPYLAAARKYLQRAQYQRNYFVSWDSVFVPADILLSSLGVGPSPGVDHAWQIATFLETWQQGHNGIKFSPQGLALAPLGGWGNLRHSANAAFMMVLHAKSTNASEAAACLAWARRQVDYMLGLAGSDRSFVVGYGSNPPTHAHHRAASCPPTPAPCTYETAFNSPAPNPRVLTGALVGGPPGPSDSYQDVRSNYQTNEVAVDYNAGFTGALAGLVQLLAPSSSSGAALA